MGDPGLLLKPASHCKGIHFFCLLLQLVLTGAGLVTHEFVGSNAQDQEKWMPGVWGWE
jgi:hypothetical protein